MHKSKEPKFEEQLKRLESIVERMESREVALEDSLALFEEGVRLARSCHQTLETARLRVEKLSPDTGALEPMEDTTPERTAP